jgi:hypothetical protein
VGHSLSATGRAFCRHCAEQLTTPGVAYKQDVHVLLCDVSQQTWKDASMRRSLSCLTPPLPADTAMMCHPPPRQVHRMHACQRPPLALGALATTHRQQGLVAADTPLKCTLPTAHAHTATLVFGFKAREAEPKKVPPTGKSQPLSNDSDPVLTMEASTHSRKLTIFF